MARVSRKAAAMDTGSRAGFQPERIYNTAVYARLSVEDNNRAGDRESIAMQRYMLETIIHIVPSNTKINSYIKGIRSISSLGITDNCMCTFFL